LGVLAVLAPLSLLAWRWLSPPEDALAKDVGPFDAIATRAPVSPAIGARATSAPLIHGKVRSSNGLWLEGALVCVARAADMAEARRSCQRSGKGGVFGFEGLDGEPFAVEASALEHLPVRLTWGGARGEQRGPELIIELRAGGARMSGSVVDAGAGPVPGAIVQVNPELGSPAFAIADRSGAFVAYVAPGSVELFAAADGYAPARRRAVAPSDGLKIVMAPGGTMAGRVVEEKSGRLIPDLDLTLLGHGATAGRASTKTLADGTFRFSHLSPGSYDLAADPAPWTGALDGIYVGAGESTEVVLTVAAASTLTGELRVGGTPCTDGVVTLLGPRPSTAPVGEDGIARIAGLPAGHYRADLRCRGARQASDELDVELGRDLSRTWDLEPGASVRGLVVGPEGAPRSGSRVRISADADGASQECATQSGGVFECSGLAPGSYHCWAARDSGEPLSEPVAATADVAGPASIVIRVFGSGSIQVRFTSRDPRELSDLPVYVKRDHALLMEARPLGEGRYLADNLPLGSYDVIVGARVDRPAATVHLARDGESQTVEIAAPAKAILFGRVLDERDTPVPNAWVQAENDQALLPAPGGASTALTDASGRFTIEGLLAGTYRLKVESSTGEAVADSVTTGVESTLRLRTYGEIGGKVVDQAGVPVRRFEIVCTADGATLARAVTRDDGSWLMERVPPGSWLVTATSDTGRASGWVQVSPGDKPRITLVVRGGPAWSAPEDAASFADSPGGEAR
jgi:hypothetical protein